MKYLYIYRSIATPSLAITLFVCYQFWKLGSGHGIVFLIWEKIITSAVLLTYLYFFKSRYIYFFMNLGTSRKFFYLAIAAIDLLFFTLAMVLTSFLK